MHVEITKVMIKVLLLCAIYINFRDRGGKRLAPQFSSQNKHVAAD